MGKEYQASTEERIIAAARTVFTRRGFHGARMQEIADEAGINKALLHYYFRSKEKLFEVIFTDLFGKFQTAFFSILASDRPLVEKIRLIVETDIDLLMQHPDVPLFVLHEMARNPEQMAERAGAAGLPDLIGEFSRQVKRAARKGEIRKIDPIDLLVNILALNRFPFVGRPMLQSITGIDEASFRAMMKRRRTQVAELIIGDLKRRITEPEA